MRGVLVVDGAAFFRSHVARLVRGWGWAVAGLCATAAEALAACRRDRPGAVVMDLFLPDGDGRRLLAEIRSLDPALPVIVCTAAADRASVAAAMGLGARDYLVKPVDEERLRAALAACLGEPDARQAPPAARADGPGKGDALGGAAGARGGAGTAGRGTGESGALGARGGAAF